MALEDFVDPEVGIAVAATALATSPKVRGLVRQGLVYGLAGVRRLGDSVSASARGMAQSAQQAASSTVQDASAQAGGGARSRRTTRNGRDESKS